MGARRTGREAALQMLFAVEAGDASAEETIRLFWRNFEGDPEGREYAEAIVRGVDATRPDLDARITAASKNWRIERMTRLDRNLLRLGTWELVHSLQVPRAVVLDEAVELAKEFGAEDSPAFVNGVLAAIADSVGRA
jgi:N utilization substance protein B